jgi:hypothetical protein
MKGFLVYPIKLIPLLSILLLVGCAVPSDVGEDINVGKSGDLEKVLVLTISGIMLPRWRS